MMHETRRDMVGVCLEGRVGCSVAMSTTRMKLSAVLAAS